LVLALALELSLDEISRDVLSDAALKRYRRKLKEEGARLKKARAGLLALRRSFLGVLKPEGVEQLDLPDGSIKLEIGANPIDEMVKAIDMFLRKLNAVKVGRKTSPVSCAVRHLDHFVDHQNASLSPAKRVDLLHYVFDEVRRRHGHRSRSQDRDPDETPRYCDLLGKQRGTRGGAENRPKKKPNLR